jgi:hypothetical protein
MCKEMPVILVSRVVDKKRIIGKMEGPGGEALGVADQKEALSMYRYFACRHFVCQRFFT